MTVTTTQALGGWPPGEVKVGPHGYIHGWHFVGVPGVGERVHHPHLGKGTITGIGGGQVHVRFDSGHAQPFEHRTGPGPGKFVKHGEGVTADVPMMLHRLGQIRGQLGTRSPADRKLEAAAAALHGELSAPGFDPATADLHSVGGKLAAVEAAATGRHASGPMQSTIGGLRDEIESMAHSRGQLSAVRHDGHAAREDAITANAARFASHAADARQLAADVRAIPDTARGTSVEDYALNKAADSYDAAAGHFDAGREYEGTRALQTAVRGLGIHTQNKRQEAYKAQERLRSSAGAPHEAASRRNADLAQRRSDTATGIAMRGQALADASSRAYKLRDVNGTELRAGDTAEWLTGPKAGDHVTVTARDLTPGMMMDPSHIRVVSRAPAPDAGRDLSGHAEAALHLASSARSLAPRDAEEHFTQDAGGKLESAAAHLKAGRGAEGVSDLAVASALLHRHASILPEDDADAEGLAAAAGSLHAAAAGREGGEHGNLMAAAAPHADKLPGGVPLGYATDAQLHDAIGKGEADKVAAGSEDAEYARLRAKYPDGPEHIASLRALEASQGAGTAGPFHLTTVDDRGRPTYHTIHTAERRDQLTAQAGKRGLTVTENPGPHDLAGLPKAARDLHEHALANGWDTSVRTGVQQAGGRPVAGVTAYHPEKGLKVSQGWLEGRKQGGESLQQSMNRIGAARRIEHTASALVPAGEQAWEPLSPSDRGGPGHRMRRRHRT